MRGSLWATRPLGEIVEVLDGRRVPVSAAERAARPGTVPYFGATGRVGSIDAALFDEPLLLLGEDGVQFFDRHRPKAYLVDGPAWVNNHAHVLRARQELVERRFLLHYLNVFDFAGYANGTTRLKLTQAAMRRIPVPVPALDEQRRIVDILEDHLSRLDAAAKALRVNSARASVLADAVVRAEITGRSVGGPRGAAALAPNGVDDGDLSPLPIGWTWVRLGDLADVVGGVTKDSKRQTDPSFVEVPYLRVANVQRGHLDLSTLTTIRVPPQKADMLRLLPGDVLLNEGGDRDKLGRGWVWAGEIPDCIHQNHVFRARVRDARIDPLLVSWAANTIGGRWCDRNGTQSVNLASISLRKIRLMPIPVPPVEDQTAIVGRAKDAIDATEHLRAELQRGLLRANSLRSAVLDAAFSGRLTGAASDVDRMAELAGV